MTFIYIQRFQGSSILLLYHLKAFTIWYDTNGVMNPYDNKSYPEVAVRISAWPSASGAASANWARAAERPVWSDRTPARWPRCSDPQRQPLGHAGHRCHCSRLADPAAPEGPATDAPGRWIVPCFPHRRATAGNNGSRGWWTPSKHRPNPVAGVLAGGLLQRL